jgi:hypothetical protein
MHVFPKMLSAAAIALLSGCGAPDAEPGERPADSRHPVDIAVAIDRTAILHGDQALAQAYRAAVLTAVEPTITRGGRLSIRLFGKVGAHSLDIRSETVPTLREEGVAVRGPGETDRREAVAAALDVALGLTEPTPDIRRSLEAVTPGSGSDIARVVGQELEAAASGTAPESVVLVLTDGVVNDGEIVVSGEPAEVGLAIAKQAGVPEDTERVSRLRVAGIGLTSGGEAPDADRVEHLVASWKAACDALPAERCEISAKP